MLSRCKLRSLERSSSNCALLLFVSFYSKEGVLTELFTIFTPLIYVDVDVDVSTKVKSSYDIDEKV